MRPPAPPMRPRRSTWAIFWPIAQAAAPWTKVVPTWRGVAWCDLRQVLPEFVSRSIEEALPLLDKRLRGFASKTAVMTGVETRSSALAHRASERHDAGGFSRRADSSQNGTGVYPCGEGAGYAGGIMSAAVDGFARGRSSYRRLHAKRRGLIFRSAGARALLLASKRDLGATSAAVSAKSTVAGAK